jgi:hypothetical protein
MPVAASKAARAAAVRRAILSEFGVDLHADDEDLEQQQKSCFLAALLVMKMVQNDGKVRLIVDLRLRQLAHTSSTNLPLGFCFPGAPNR